MTDSERERRMRELVHTVAEPVRRYLHRRTDPATADDVLGDVLLVCWRRLDDVPDDPLPWAIVVARNGLANARRAERRRTRLVGKIIAIDPPASAAPESPSEALSDAAGDASGTTSARLHAALGRLRRDDAELLRLWAWDELSSPQLAVVLGISANAAAIRLHRAKARLKAELLKDDRPPGHVTREEGSRDDRR